MTLTSIKRGAALWCMAWLFAVPAHATPLAKLMNDFGVQQPRESKPAPAFSLPDLNGGQAALSDLRGKLVLLHFWATWCVPCRHELPLLQALEQQGIDGLGIISVNVNRGNKDTVKTFINAVTLGFHTLLDPDGTVRHQYAIRGLPTTYLIDPDGNILGRIIGERDWSQAVPILLKLMNIAVIPSTPVTAPEQLKALRSSSMDAVHSTDPLPIPPEALTEDINK